MPPKAAKESNTGMVITIVFLVILAIGLGVATYYGFAQQGDLQKQIATAQQEKKTMENSRDWEKFKADLLEAYAGYLPKEQETELQALRDKYAKNQFGSSPPPDKPAVDQMVQKLDGSLGWDPGLNKPTETFVARVDALNKQIADLQAAQAKADADNKAAIADLQALLKTEKDQNAAYATKLADAEKRAAEAVNTHSASFLEAQKTIGDRNAEIAKLRNDAETTRADLEKQLARLTKENKDVRQVADKYKASAEPAVDIVKLDQPKGKVVSINPSGQFVYIDLGSADHVKPQLTFSIFGVGADGRPAAERKGALEVVNATEPHLSLAKVTELRNPNQDPVMVGDLLYNPAWSPGLQQHVAIAGMIDLYGDGQDHTQEFIRELQKQNIVVDAYLDLRDMTIKGPGITLQTNFLVLGPAPTFEATSALSGATAERKKEIITKMSQMESDANRVGVTSIPVRRFLALIGYKLPRGATEPDYTARPAAVTAPAQPAKER